MNPLQHAAEAYAEGNIAASRAIASTCLSRAEAKGDQHLEAHARWQLAQAAMVCGNATSALAEAERASQLFDSLKDEANETRALITVAYAATQLRDNGLALESGTRALRLSKRLRRPELEAAANNYLGVALFWEDDAAAADRHLRAAVDLARRIPGGNAHVRPMVNRAAGALVHLVHQRILHEAPPDASVLAPLVDELSSGCDLSSVMPFLSGGFQLDCEAIAAWLSFFGACWGDKPAQARDYLALCSSRAESGRLALRWIVPYVDWARHEYARATGRWDEAARSADQMVASARHVQNGQLVWLGSALKVGTLEALGRHAEALRAWRSLNGSDMEQRRTLRSRSEWLLQLRHPDAESGTPSASAVRRLPFADARMERQRKLAAWQKRFGLTPAEVEVLDLLLDGMSPEDIANKRGTEVSTARSQLKSLFSKTDFHSQRELVAKFNSADDERR